MFARLFGFVVLGLLLTWSNAANSPLKSGAKIVVLVFVSSECPISNKMAPEIERLHRKYSTNNVAFMIVYPNAPDTDAKISAHRKDYSFTGPFLRDAKHELVKRAGVRITPEAVVFNESRDVAYRGRINDQFLALGKSRPQATVHDLEDAINALLAGKQPKHAQTEAVGCSIQD
jgi:thiol-disulfide isomerase/thioredoxin